MGSLTATTPKPLLALHGRPIIEHILGGLHDAGITDAVIVTGYRGEQIETHLGDGAGVGVRLSYRRQDMAEDAARGTARALLLARDALGEQPFVLTWGDVVIDPSDYGALLAEFRRTPCDVLLTLNEVDDPWRGAAVYVDDHWRVTRLIEKPPRGTSRTRWNNAGVFVFTARIFPYLARLQPSTRGEYELPQAIAAMIADGCLVRALPLQGFWSDLGTPEDLAAAEHAPVARVFSMDRSPLRGASGQDWALGAATSDRLPAAGVSQLDAAERRRIDALCGRYRKIYGRAAAFVVRAPGRVNLLGEHTDYNGLPVLPMAIDRSVLIAGAARTDSLVKIRNVTPRFRSRSYTIAESIPAFPSGDWGNYSKAAAQAVADYCHGDPCGADLLVDGNIPSAAGLSSSSALVVATTLALLAANDVDVPYATLAERLPAAERYVGTLSGGMDQAVSLLAQAGHALRIDFFPLRVRTVPLPAGYAVVVCHSLVAAEKSLGAKLAYNRRVIECRLVCRVLEAALGSGLPRDLQTLGDLATLFPGRPLLDFLEYLQLPDRPLSVAEIAAAIGTSPERLRADCDVGPDDDDYFSLTRRARHVFAEAARVDQAEDCLRRGDAVDFGQLMTASHASCRDDYEISCPELEALVIAAMQAGTVGARLTGAGFGGCTVNLVAEDDVRVFLQRMDRDFYAPRLPAGAHAGDYRFIFAPQAGASVMRV